MRLVVPQLALLSAQQEHMLLLALHHALLALGTPSQLPSLVLALPVRLT